MTASPTDPLVVRVIARLNVGGPAIHTTLLTEGLGRRGFRSRRWPDCR